VLTALPYSWIRRKEKAEGRIEEKQNGRKESERDGRVGAAFW